MEHGLTAESSPNDQTLVGESRGEGELDAIHRARWKSGQC